VSTHFKNLPGWAVLSLAANGLLVLAIAWVLLPDNRWSVSSAVNQKTATTPVSYPTPEPTSELGPRHQLNYQQWLGLLAREAEVVATKQPEHLAILLGDSLSLWFPVQMLPSDRNWLNQGISGETSEGLLNRLDLFDKTQPEVIFVLIGINDLIRGLSDETILTNQQQIVRYLRQVHPQAKIVLQSILPHGGQKATWERRDRLLSIPNSRIRELNQQLKAIAQEEEVSYLDLYPLFADTEGNLKMDLSSDGLHLNPQGYLIWRSALIVFNQLSLPPSAFKPTTGTE
jgi:lysophospholipase L1-like esterase